MMKSKAEKLLERFPVTDLALAITYRGSNRERFLTRFVDSFTPQSYRAVRDASPQIYNVQTPLFALPPPTWQDVEKKIRRIAGRFNAERNVDAARHLRKLISARRFTAHPIPEQFIHIAPGRIVKIGLNFYLVEQDETIFQFVQPRADARMDESVARCLMSLVHYAYVFGDFENAVVEMADLSTIERGGERVPRFHRLSSGALLSRSQLNSEIDAVHSLLEQIANRK
jgi:hypothetical protein